MVNNDHLPTAGAHVAPSSPGGARVLRHLSGVDPGTLQSGRAGPAAYLLGVQRPVVRLVDVTVVRAGADVLRAVSWVVGAGERWILLGPNGSGKTTLLEVAGGYALPTRGTVDILGERVGRVDLRQLRRRIGHASAPLERLIRPHLTALEIVATGKHAMLTRFRERYEDGDWSRARRLLDELGVGELADRPAGRLSEGERRRVHLARSLMPDPELLLLDEPSAGLDLGGRERLVTSLAALARLPRPSAIVFATHHVEEIPPGFTHAALVCRGTVHAQGQLSDVLTDEALSELFETRVDVRQDESGRWSARARTG